MTNRSHHSQVGGKEIRLDFTAFEFLINEFFDEKEEKVIGLQQILMLIKVARGFAKGPLQLNLINIKDHRRWLIEFSRHSKNLGTKRVRGAYEVGPLRAI